MCCWLGLCFVSAYLVKHVEYYTVSLRRCTLTSTRHTAVSVRALAACMRPGPHDSVQRCGNPVHLGVAGIHTRKTRHAGRYIDLWHEQCAEGLDLSVNNEPRTILHLFFGEARLVDWPPLGRIYPPRTIPPGGVEEVFGTRCSPFYSWTRTGPGSSGLPL